jgi:hypothetical protein
LELPQLDGWVSAQIAAEHLGYMIVSALGFSLGFGYSVEIIQVIEENGTPHVFGVSVGNLGFNPHDPVFSRALQLAGENLFFRLALRDYMRAITDTTDCATYCFRAIESIKSACALQAGNDSWDAMHTALGTNREDIERRVKQFADPIRHGNWVAAPSTNSATRLDILSCTRAILDRYLERMKPAAG